MRFTDCRNTMEGFYFDRPMQVKFKLEDDEKSSGGIAFDSQIICGCCGSLIDFEDCEFIETLEWIDISEEIKGSDEDE